MRTWFSKQWKRITEWRKPKPTPYTGLFNGWIVDNYKMYPRNGDHCLWICGGFKFFADYGTYLYINGGTYYPFPLVDALSRGERKLLWKEAKLYIERCKQEELDMIVVKDA